MAHLFLYAPTSLFSIQKIIFAVMMHFIDLILLAVALSMDCFTISIISGVTLRRRL